MALVSTVFRQDHDHFSRHLGKKWPGAASAAALWPPYRARTN
jgi:hypothetical protein